MKYLAGVISLLFVLYAHAVDVPMEFEDAQQQQRYQGLLDELRCLVCQNQTLADSHAPLAQDLRNEVYKMVAEGESNEAIIDFLVERYGDFVLFRPPVKGATILLWYGPFILLFIAILAVYMFVKSLRSGEVAVTQEEQDRLLQLLGDERKE